MEKVFDQAIAADVSRGLARWYGLVLDAGAAEQLVGQCRVQLRLGNISAFHGFWLECEVMKGRFWLEGGCEADYQYLKVKAEGAVESALLELVYGQLLMSRKLCSANFHLDKGFWLAAGLLSARDYFRVLRRHRDLECLVLTDTPAPPRTLEELIKEAGVIRRLTRGEAGICNNPKGHGDTVG